MKPESVPLSISVIIPAYNAAGTIGRAIRSALSQMNVTQVIVVDDASSDETYSRALEADDGSDRLRILRQSQNSGPAAARNRALDMCTGTFIALLDSDDFLLPDRMAGMLSYAPMADFIADDLYQVDEGNESDPLAYRRLFDPWVTEPRKISLDEFVRSNITKKKRSRGEMGFVKPLMRRMFLTENNLRYRDDLRLGEDYDLYTRALIAGAKFLVIPAQGYVSVLRASSLSGQHSESDLERLLNCDFEMLKDARLSPNEKKALTAHASSINCRLQWRLLINAVKQRNIFCFMRTFMHPWPVPLYLTRNLLGEFFKRVLKVKP